MIEIEKGCVYERQKELIFACVGCKLTWMYSLLLSSLGVQALLS